MGEDTPAEVTKESALEAAAAATIPDPATSEEDAAKAVTDALAHVDKALESYPGDADLLAAKAELEQLAPPASTTPEVAPEPPAEEEPPLAPLVLGIPPHEEATGGWPNDWPVWKPDASVRAKRIDVPFVIADIRGDAGDYAVLRLDGNGEIVEVSVEKAATFEQGWTPQP